jgi:hypothetical protein
MGLKEPVLKTRCIGKPDPLGTATLTLWVKVKVKGKVHPRTGQEGPKWSSDMI